MALQVEHKHNRDPAIRVAEGVGEGGRTHAQQRMRKNNGPDARTHTHARTHARAQHSTTATHATAGEGTQFSARVNQIGFSPSFRRRRRPPISGWGSFGGSFGKPGFILVPAAVAKIHACSRIPEGQTVSKTRRGVKNSANAPHLGAFCVFVAFFGKEF